MIRPTSTRIFLLNLFVWLFLYSSVIVWRSMTLVLNNWSFLTYHLRRLIEIKTSHKSNFLILALASVTASCPTLRPRISNVMSTLSYLIQWRTTRSIVMYSSPSSNIAWAITACNLLPTSTCVADHVKGYSRTIWKITIIRSWIHRNASTTLKMTLLLIYDFLREVCHFQSSLTSDSACHCKRMLIKITSMNYNAWVMYNWISQLMMPWLLRLHS